MVLAFFQTTPAVRTTPVPGEQFTSHPMSVPSLRTLSELESYYNQYCPIPIRLMNISDSSSHYVATLKSIRLAPGYAVAILMSIPADNGLESIDLPACRATQQIIRQAMDT